MVSELAPAVAPARDVQTQREAISRALRQAAREARTPKNYVSGGAGPQALRRRVLFKRGLILSSILLVLCPFIVFSVYWGLIASKQYAVEMKFAVRAGEGPALGSVSGLLGMAMSQQAQDTQIVGNYIRSRAAMETLDKTLNLRTIYSREDVDYFSRFDNEDPKEDLEKYWKRKIDVHIDTLSGIVTVDARAFTPEDAYKIASQISVISENLVNDLSTRARRDALSQAQTELQRAENRLQAATLAMRDTRNAEGVIDAVSSAEAANKVVTALRIELAKTEQDLEAQANVSQTAPHIKVLRAKIATLKRQVADYTHQIASAQKAAEPTLATHLSVLSRAQVDVDFAQKQYEEAAATLENARVDTQTRHTYLATFLGPVIPEKSTYPKRWLEWLIWFGPFFAVWSLAASLAFYVRDHRAP